MPHTKPKRGGDDQLFREVIQARPADFLSLAVPDLAVQVDAAALEFKLEEYFTDSPRGGRPRRPDLVARVATLVDPRAFVAFHVEVEAKYLEASLGRLCAYNPLLSLRYGCPVHTVVVYVRGGEPGVVHHVYTVDSLGRTTTTCHYDSLGLSSAWAVVYLARPEPLAWAFAAMMRPGELGSRAQLRLACLRRIVAAREELTEDESFRLFNFVASYIESDRGVSEEYDELFRRPENQEVQEMVINWAEQRREEGHAAGVAEGRDEMFRESLDRMQNLALDVMAENFGTIPRKIRRLVCRIDSLDELTRVVKDAASAASLDDLRLNGQRP